MLAPNVCNATYVTAKPQGLLYCFGEFLERLDNGKQIVVSHFHFSRVSDSVYNHVLRPKLQLFGICMPVHQSLKVFLVSMIF